MHRKVQWQPYPDAGEFALEPGDYQLVARMRCSAIRVLGDGIRAEIHQHDGSVGGSWGSCDFTVERPTRARVEVSIGDGDGPFITATQIVKLEITGKRTSIEPV